MYYESLSHQIKDIVKDQINQLDYASIFDVDDFMQPNSMDASSTAPIIEINRAAQNVGNNNDQININTQEQPEATSSYNKSRNKNEIISGFNQQIELPEYFSGTAISGTTVTINRGIAIWADDTIQEILTAFVETIDPYDFIENPIKYYSISKDNGVMSTRSEILDNIQIAMLEIFEISNPDLNSSGTVYTSKITDRRESIAKIRDISNHNFDNLAHYNKFISINNNISLLNENLLSLSGTVESHTQQISAVFGTVESHTQQISTLSGTLQQARETLSIISENYVPAGNFSAENLIVLTSGTDPSGTATLKIETTIKRGIDLVESFADSQPIVVTGTINYISGTSVTCSIVNNSTGARLIPEIDLSPEEPIEFKIYNILNENIPSGTFEIHWNMI